MNDILRNECFSESVSVAGHRGETILATVKWFVSQPRPSGVLPYEILIDNYHSLSSDIQQLMVSIMDEYFYFEEPHILEWIVRQELGIGMKINPREVPFSFVSDIEVGRVSNSFKNAARNLTPTSPYAVIPLPGTPSVNLPFPVMGWYFRGFLGGAQNGV